jgi:hypothetical protein
MSVSSANRGLHVATLSGWYRFEYDGGQWRQLNRDLTYWTLTCMSVDPQNSAIIYVGTEHSGLFYTKNGGVMVGPAPSAVYRRTDGGWQELKGVRPCITSVELAG